MQVQLVVANEQNKGKSVPINQSAFKIGRADDCQLRSKSQQVSRYHAVIRTENGIVAVQDLGGENGTFVNGNRVTAIQTLKDGDKLAVGPHIFIVSIKQGEAKENSQRDDFELTSLSPPNASAVEKGSDTNSIDPATLKTIVQQTTKNPEQEAEIMFEIRLDGQRVSVTKSRLFDLARKGSVLPDDLIMVGGTKVFADSIQGIVFGDKSSAPAPPVAASPSIVNQPAAAAPVTDSDPFAFPDFGGADAETTMPFNVESEPYVQVGRRESAFSALWKALDISFSRVYTLEGNGLVIHSIKALYYIIVVICSLMFFKILLDFCLEWSKSGNFLEELQRHSVGFAATTFGAVTIVVIVRVLLEMLLLAWFESAKQPEPEESKVEK